MTPLPAPAHTFTDSEILKYLESSRNGLSTSEINKRYIEFGKNSLPESGKLKIVTLFFSQFANAMVVLMATAGALSFMFDHYFDAMLIFSIVLLNAVMGFIQEFRAEQSIAALKKLIVSKVLVRRDGKTIEIEQEYVTVGDIILLQEGDKVPADAYLLYANNLSVNEASLTGESLPVEKITGKLNGQIPLAERRNMVWMGTAITQGTAEAVVVAVGSKTEFGTIAKSLESVVLDEEHFSKKIKILSKQMSLVAVFSAIATFCVGYFLRGISIVDISIFTIATLVSALPEGLPIILVIVLAVGAQRMAKKNAIVRKLSATETLGVVSVIITDKTGTLTKNTMTARKIFLPNQKIITVHATPANQESTFTQENAPFSSEDYQFRTLATIAGICNQVKITDKDTITFSTIFGDPTEKALYLLAYQAGFTEFHAADVPKLIENIPFQQHLKMRGSLILLNGTHVLVSVGAPEQILSRCSQVETKNGPKSLVDQEKKEIGKQIELLSSEGLRVVALAKFTAPEKKQLQPSDLDTSDGTFVGAIGIYDPPRPEVAQALSIAKRAGIKIYMATGDHPNTALAIGKEIGLVSSDYTLDAVLTQKDIDTVSDSELYEKLKNSKILARLSPEAKMKLTHIFQKYGEIVAMTGDGVNDAPALKKADVGISMGIAGTEVARESSKIVLADDNFASIISAVQEGRTQFSNLRRTSFFLIMTNVAESASLLIALILGFPLPLLPVQILWLNIITGGLTDFALSLEPSHDDTMSRPPRSADENILIPSVFPLVGSITVVTTILCLLAFDYFLPQSLEKARTAVFVILSFSQLLNMFNLRSLRKSVAKIGVFSNKAIVFAFLLSFTFLMVALWFPPIQNALQFTHIDFSELLILFLGSLLIFFVAEGIKFVSLKREKV